MRRAGAADEDPPGGHLRPMDIGVFVDRRRRRAYVLPLPCIGVRIDW